MQKSRTYNSIMNSCIGMISAIINIALNLAVRVVIVRFLGDEINGVHSLFQSIMSILAVMETSLTTAMIINLYRPIKDKDNDIVSKLMHIYHGLYSALAFAFFVISIVINMVMDVFMATEDNKVIHIYFLIFSLSFIANYLTYSHRSILYGEQNNRFSVVATTISELVFRGLGIILVVSSKEYWPFLVCLVFEKLFGNFICRNKVLQNHKYLRNIKKTDVDKNLREKILFSAKPLFVNQLAITVQNASPSIIIGIVLKNVSLIGYYGNYQLIVGAMSALFSQIGAAFTSSFGNLAAGNDKKHMQLVYKRVHFIITSVATICSCGFAACVNEFIIFAFGYSHLLPYSTALLITICMFANLSNVTIISIQNATGTHKLDSKYMVLQAIITIVSCFIGGNMSGINGIVIGLTLPTIIFTTIIKGLLVLNHCLEYSKENILKEIIVVYIKALLVLSFVLCICKYIVLSNVLLRFITKGVVSVVCAAVLIAVFSTNNDGYKYLIGIIKNRCRI